MKETQQERSGPVTAMHPTPRSEVERRLIALFDEIHLELQESIGEMERFSQLIAEMPSLRTFVDHELPSVKERSSRLLGHLRAIEKAYTHVRQRQRLEEVAVASN